MPSVLTESSSVACAHGGAVQLRAGQSRLTVGGSKVLVAGDLTGAAVSAACTHPTTNTGSVKCATVASALGGVATKLKVGGRGVLLETIQGLTSGQPPPQTWSVKSAGQTKLRTT